MKNIRILAFLILFTNCSEEEKIPKEEKILDRPPFEDFWLSIQVYSSNMQSINPYRIGDYYNVFGTMPGSNGPNAYRYILSKTHPDLLPVNGFLTINTSNSITTIHAFGKIKREGDHLPYTYSKYEEGWEDEILEFDYKVSFNIATKTAVNGNLKLFNSKFRTEIDLNNFLHIEFFDDPNRPGTGKKIISISVHPNNLRIIEGMSIDPRFSIREE